MSICTTQVCEYSIIQYTESTKSFCKKLAEIGISFYLKKQDSLNLSISMKVECREQQIICKLMKMISK